MAAMLFLSQEMLLRKSGVAPTIKLPIMVLKMAQALLRHNLPRRFKVIKIAISHPDKCIFAGFTTPETLLKICVPQAKPLAIRMI
jgi:hypothetical protein